MNVVVFGENNSECIVLLHGGGLSWWNYKKAALLLCEKYRVIMPILDGHAGCDVGFTSIEDNAARIVSYIDDKCGGHVLAMSGLSLGGQILAEILSIRPDICGFALIESACVKSMPITGALIGPSLDMSFGLIKQRWFSKLQFDYLKIDPQLFEDYYADTCKIKKTDMVAFMKANCAYKLKPGVKSIRSKLLVVCGGRERPIIRASAKLLCEAVANARLQILKGYCHGDLSINHPEQFVQILVQMMKE